MKGVGLSGNKQVILGPRTQRVPGEPSSAGLRKPTDFSITRLILALGLGVRVWGLKTCGCGDPGAQSLLAVKLLAPGHQAQTRRPFRKHKSKGA